MTFFFLKKFEIIPFLFVYWKNRIISGSNEPQHGKKKVFWSGLERV